MKILGMVLIVLFSGCAGVQNTFNADEFPWSPPEISAGLTAEVSIRMEGGGESLRVDYDTELLSNDFVIDGVSYQLYHNHIAEFPLSVMRNSDYASVEVLTAYFDVPCPDSDCPPQLQLELGQAGPGFPFPLSQGQSWGHAVDGLQMQFEVKGGKTLSVQGYTYNVIHIGMEANVGAGISIGGSYYIDVASGMVVRNQIDASGQGEKIKLVIDVYNIQPGSMSNLDAEGAAYHVEHGALVGDHLQAYLYGIRDVDMDVQPEVRLVGLSNGELELSVQREGDTLTRGPSPLTFAPDYPGTYTVTATATRDGETVTTSEDFLVDGTLNLTALCSMGSGLVDPTCPDLEFDVPAGVTEITAREVVEDIGRVTVWDGSVYQAEPLLFGNGVQFAHDGSAQDMHLRYEAYADAGAERDFTVRLEMLDGASQSGNLEWLGQFLLSGPVLAHV